MKTNVNVEPKTAPKEVVKVEPKVPYSTKATKQIIVETPMTRMEACATALKDRKPKTVAAWIKATNEIMGKPNDKESLCMIKHASKAFKVYGITFPTE